MACGQFSHNKNGTITLLNTEKKEEGKRRRRRRRRKIDLNRLGSGFYVCINL